VVRLDITSVTSVGAEEADAGDVVGPLWWVDDDLLCGGQADGHVRCWRAGLGSFQLPDLAPTGFAAVALARP
jgi:hypothetical protein